MVYINAHVSEPGYEENYNAIFYTVGPEKVPRYSQVGSDPEKFRNHLTG